MTYAAYKCDLRRMQPSVWETAYILTVEMQRGQEGHILQ